MIPFPSSSLPPFALNDLDAADGSISMAECEQMVSDALQDTQDLLYSVGGSGSDQLLSHEDSVPSSGLDLSAAEASDWLNFDFLSNDASIFDVPAPVDYTPEPLPDLVVADEPMTAAEALRNVQSTVTYTTPAHVLPPRLPSLTSSKLPSSGPHRRWSNDESPSRTHVQSRGRSLPTSPTPGLMNSPDLRTQSTFVLPSCLQPVPRTPSPKPQPPPVHVSRREGTSVSRPPSTYVLPSGSSSRSVPRRSQSLYSPYFSPQIPSRSQRQESVQQDEPGFVFVNFVLASDGGIVSSSSRPRGLASHQPRQQQRSRSYFSSNQGTTQFYRDGDGQRPMTICL